MSRRGSVLIAAIAAGSLAGWPGRAASPRPFEFSCATFPPGTTEADLIGRLGADHVRAAPVLGGGAEGEYTDGTVLFPETTDAKVEILWNDRASRREPNFVWIEGNQSRWRSPEGITLGTDLRTIERINRRPFRMAGFGFDGSGAVLSWGEGRLAARAEAGCTMRLSLEFHDGRAIGVTGPAAEAISRQVLGDREFSSGHPAMQALDPRVYRMGLRYSSIFQ